MRLGISNLAWSPQDEAAAMRLLAGSCVQGIEVAPTRIAPWNELKATDLHTLRKTCDEHGLTIPSLQAIFYQVPEAALLGNQKQFYAMREHVRRVGAIAEALGASVAVFGAPRNRLRGGMAPDAAFELAAERLAAIGDVAAPFGLSLGIEAVPEYYGCDFLTRPAEVVDLVARCNHPNIRVHFDIACATLAGCDPTEAVMLFSPTHYHIAEAGLVPLRAPTCDHVGVAAVLRQSGYTGWLVIEMLEDKENALAAIAESVEFAHRVYPT